MAPDDSFPSAADIEGRVQQVGRYSRFVKAGLGVILGAFALAVATLLPSTLGLLPSDLDGVARAVDAILLPLIFVGMGLLLFGIGMHLHLLHLNVVRQFRERADDDSSPSETEDDP